MHPPHTATWPFAHPHSCSLACLLNIVRAPTWPPVCQSGRLPACLLTCPPNCHFAHNGTSGRVHVGWVNKICTMKEHVWPADKSLTKLQSQLACKNMLIIICKCISLLNPKWPCFWLRRNQPWPSCAFLFYAELLFMPLWVVRVLFNTLQNNLWWQEREKASKRDKLTSWQLCFGAQMASRRWFFFVLGSSFFGIITSSRAERSDASCFWQPIKVVLSSANGSQVKLMFPLIIKCLHFFLSETTCPV